MVVFVTTCSILLSVAELDRQVQALIHEQEAREHCVCACVVTLTHLPLGPNLYALPDGGLCGWCVGWDEVVAECWCWIVWYDIKHVNERLKCVPHPTIETYIFHIILLTKHLHCNITETSEVSFLLLRLNNPMIFVF